MTGASITQKRSRGALPTFSALAFGAITLLALVFGVYALRYALPHIPVPAPLPNFTLHRKMLIVHAVSASVALMSGPWQFIASLRRKRLGLHRWAGRVYLVAVGVAWISSLPLGFGALGGSVSTLGFLGLGVAWIGSSGMGLATILRGRVAAHKDWMLRSYALTAGAITLRLYLGVAIALHLPFVESYRVIAWASWVTNLLAAEAILLLRRPRHPVSA